MKTYFWLDEAWEYSLGDTLLPYHTGKKVLEMGYTFQRNILGLGLIFARNSWNAQVLA